LRRYFAAKRVSFGVKLIMSGDFCGGTVVELVKILLQLRLAESFNVGNMVCFGTLKLPHKATPNMAPIDDEDDEVP